MIYNNMPGAYGAIILPHIHLNASNLGGTLSYSSVVHNALSSLNVWLKNGLLDGVGFFYQKHQIWGFMMTCLISTEPYISVPLCIT